jgi:hypothetical protein
MRLALVVPPLIDGDGCSSGVGIERLLISLPKRRGPLVKARGRPLVVVVDFSGGAGEISMGSAYPFSDASMIDSFGGEFKDTVEAKEISRSESSTSFRIREAESAFRRTSAAGAIKNLSEV